MSQDTGDALARIGEFVAAENDDRGQFLACQWRWDKGTNNRLNRRAVHGTSAVLTPAKGFISLFRSIPRESRLKLHRHPNPVSFFLPLPTSLVLRCAPFYPSP